MAMISNEQRIAAVAASMDEEIRHVVTGAAAVAACPNGHGGYTVSLPGGYYGHTYTASLDDLRLLGAAIEAEPMRRASIVADWIGSLGRERCIVPLCCDVRLPRALICLGHWQRLPREVTWSWEGWDGPHATRADGRDLASQAMVALLRGDLAAAVDLTAAAVRVERQAWDRLADAVMDCFRGGTMLAPSHEYEG